MLEANQPSRSSVAVRAALTLGTATAFAFVQPATGQITWDVNGNGVWQDDANWDTGTQPNNPTDNVVILNPTNSASQVVVTVGPGLTRDAGTLTINDTGVAAKHELVVANNTFLDISLGVTNNGIITVLADTNSSQYRVQASHTLSGNGLLRLATTGGGTAQIATGLGSTTLTNAAGHTIAGTGNVGSNNIMVNNAGLIDADITGAVLLLDPLNAVDSFVNTGTLRASNGGLLRLTGVFGGNFNSTGGNIGAFGVGSEVQLVASVNVTGGVLTTDLDGLINVVDGNSAGFTDVTLALNGNLRAGNNSDAFFADTLANQGTVTLNPETTNSDFRIVNDLILSGGGTIVMNATTGAGGFAVINDGGGGGQGLLTNVNNTIRGSGQLGQNAIGLLNQANGLILADQNGNDLLIDPGTTDGATNQGTFRAANGGTLTLTGQFGGDLDNTGGTIEATGAGSAVRLFNSMNITGGTVEGTANGVIEVSDGQSGGFIDVTAFGTVEAGNNSDFFVAGTYTNNGLTSLNPETTNSDFRIVGDVVLNGGGNLFMRPTSGSGGISVINDGGGAGQGLLTNVDNTIRGSGQLGQNAIGLLNQASGTVLANQAGEDLFIDPGTTHNLTNQGLMRATSGGIMTLSGQFGGTFDNTGGTIEADGGGSLVRLFSGAEVTGGELRGLNGGVVEVSSGQSGFLADVSTAGAFRVGNNSDAYFGGTLNNTGTIDLNPETTNSDFRLIDDLTVTGGGTINLNPTTGAGGIAIVNDGGIVAGQNRLTNVNNTFRGSGNIAQNGMAFTNQSAGLVEATGAGMTLRIDPGSNALDGNTGFINQGTLRSTADTTLLLSGDFGGAFDNQAGGTIDIQSGSTLNLNGTLTHRQGAAINQAGAFNVLNGGNFINEADDYSPGASPGLVNVNSGGIFTNTADGVVTFEIDGDSTPGVDFDTIRGQGTFNLAGGIDLVFGNGFTPAFYSSIELILDTSGRNVNGTFDPVFDPIVGVGEAWAITYRADNFGNVDAVLFTRALPGDANLNGQVEQGDLDAVLQNWGNTTNTAWNTGDMSGNRQVEQSDLDLVLQNWGSTLAPDFGGFDLAQVPEPTTLGLLLPMLAGRRRRG